MESDTSGDNFFPPSEQEGGYEPARRHTSRPPQFPSEASATNLQLASRDASYAVAFDPALSPSVEGEAESYYRSFHGVTDPTTYNSFDTDGLTSMPAATDSSRLPSSLRSNSNGTTPRHPPIQAARGLKLPFSRSVSAPVEEGMAAGGTRSASGASGTQKQSVRDLARRFDSAGSQTTASTHRPLARPAKDAANHGAGYARTRGTGETPASAASARAGLLTRDVEMGRAKSTSKTQRAKFAAEDQHSNNALSSAPRSSRGGTKDLTGNPQATQSLTNLTRPSPLKLSAAKIPERKPLFGELTPNASGLSSLGYGIPSSRTRRLSDPNSQPPASPQHKIQPDIESPKSPTSPYDATGELLRDIEASKSPRAKKHNRPRGDLAVNKAGPGKGTNPLGHEAAPHQDTNAVKSPTQSRLPISSKRLSTPSESSSPPSSTRSTSPLTTKTRASHSARSPKANVRSGSPTTRSHTEARRSPRQQAHGLANTSTASLSAIISASPPKSSHPLRGSRQRLPVSTATASSSRLRAAESPYPSQHNTSKTTRGGGTSAVPSASTIDYEAHRKQIEISYSKSIKLNEENERRETERSYLACSEAGDDLSQQKEVEDPVVEPTETISPLSPAVETTHDGSLASAIDTSHLPQSQIPVDSRDDPDTLIMDSPTLGMPGTFPTSFTNGDNTIAQPPLPDAVGCTEFDKESRADSPQPSGGRPLIHPPHIITSTADIPQRCDDSPLDLNSGSGSIRIILDTQSMDRPQEALSFDSGAGQPSYDDAVSSPSYEGTPAATHPAPQPPNEVNERAGDPNAVAINITAEDQYFEEPQSLSSSDETHASSALFGMERPQNWESESPIQDQPLNLPNFEHRELDLSFSAKVHPSQENGASPVTEMEYESSEGGVEGLHGLPGHYDTPQSARLSIPYPYRLSNRLSRHSESEWTDDITYNTTEPGLGNSSHFSYTDRPAPPPKEEREPAGPDVPPKSSSYSPLPSPSPGLIGGTRISSPSRSLHNEHSPGIDSLGSSEGLKSPSKSHTVPAPLKSPPPVPQSRSETTYLQPSQAQRISLWDQPEPPKGILPWDSQARRGSRESQTQFDDEHASEETPKPVELTEEELALLKKRSHIIKELIDTEAVYLKDMNVVEEIYKGTAEACPNLEPGDVKTIFRNSGQVVGFSTMFLDELKAAAACVYTPPRGQKSRSSSILPSFGDPAFNTQQQESGYERDQKTYIGANFLRHLKEMKIVYTEFLKSHELAMNRLMVLQTTPTVKVWLDECNLVAKDLTSAWDLDALLIKPVQRITRYQLFLTELKGKTPEKHPDYSSICAAREGVQGLLQSIDSLKKRLDTVSKIVNGAPKVNVRTGLVTAFVRRRDRSLATNTNRPKDDPDFIKAHDRFSTDYLRLQIVLRDVEFYTRQIKEYATGFLTYLSAIEMFMRAHVSPYPELESKWTRFNVSMRDLGTVALETHISAVRKLVIEPFESIIKTYGPPSTALSKRGKRRLDYERSLAIKAANRKVDDKTAELVEQYEALNETLKLELPKLSSLTERLGNICLDRFTCIQIEWWGTWQAKIVAILDANQMPKEVDDIIGHFRREFRYGEAQLSELGIIKEEFLHGVEKGRLSQSTTATRDDDASVGSRTRNGTLSVGSRSRGKSVNSDHSPNLPTPELQNRFSDGIFQNLEMTSSRRQTIEYPPITRENWLGSPAAAAVDSTTRPHSTRPSTGRSHDSGGPSRTSGDAGDIRTASTRTLITPQHLGYDNPETSTQKLHSSYPVEFDESPESPNSSPVDGEASGDYKILYLAASLFEFSFSGDKRVGDLRYLTYQAGEVFDVIGENGELWLARNQDDPKQEIGWIWSKHFARLAAD